VGTSDRRVYACRVSKKLIFIHVQKTAGTSVRIALESRFEPDKVRPIGLPHDPTEGVRALRKYDFISYHLSADLWNFMGAGYLSLTILREPRARLVSLYNMHRAMNPESMKTLPPEKQVLWETAMNSSLLEFLRTDDPSIRALIQDGMVRQLASGLHDQSERSRDVALAIENLNRMDVVGTTEMLHATLALLCRKMDWHKPLELQHHARVERTVELETLDDETRAELDKQTRLDQRLYGAALAKLDRDLAAVSLAEPTHDRVHGSGKNDAGTTAEPVVIAMDGPTPGEGWHVREGPPDQPTRWTGPDTTSTVSVRLSPDNDYLIDLRLRGHMSQEIFNGIQLKSGTRVFPWFARNENQGENIIEAKLPREAVNPDGPTKLTIEVPHTLSHRDLFPENPDLRQKGIAVTRISLIPV
jgi:hypothetical protein